MIVDDHLDIDIKRLLEEEKKARMDGDNPKSSILCVDILKYFATKGDYENFRNYMVLLSKKRSQSKKAITEYTKYALNEVYQTLNQEEQIKLLKTINDISDGKIYVEYEYSISVRRLTEIYKSQGNIEEASKLIQDIQIETFASVDRSYKVDYILFQMRILLQKEDYIRTLIVSNKINRKHLNDDNLIRLKLEFYQLMIIYYQHEKAFLDVSKCYKVLYDFIKEIELRLTGGSNLETKYVDSAKEILSIVNKHTIFMNYVMYLSICPPELETRNMLNELNIFYRKDLEEIKDMDLIVKRKLSDDLIFIDDSFLRIFNDYPIFKLSQENPNAEEHKQIFRKQLIQHNLLIFQKFFSNVRLQRIGEMINISHGEVETELAEMVINKYIYAKINRMTGTVAFKPKQDGNAKLDDISLDLSKMLKTLETTCHLIHKENLKYDIK